MSAELLRDLDNDKPEDIAAALQRCVAAMRNGQVREPNLVALCERLVVLGGHEDRQVRRGVAEAGQYVPDPYFEQIVPRLEKDQNFYVKEAAELSRRVRSARRRESVALDDQAAHIEQLVRKIEKEHGKLARRRVRELADHEIEFFAQKLRHEFKRGATVLQISIANLKSAAQQRVVDRERVLSEVATLSTVAQLLLSVVSSACDVAEVAPSRFKQENLRALVAQAVHLLAEQIGRERLDVELDVDDGLTLDVDRGKLLQAFLNVLHNAAEAYSGDSAERIKIGIVGRVVRGGTQVVVTFTDQGCGIGADELPHVFAPFGTSKTREPRVRGLGLLNVKRMIESGHGGEVRIESTKGVGTSVTVLLPRQQKA